MKRSRDRPKNECIYQVKRYKGAHCYVKTKIHPS